MQHKVAKESLLNLDETMNNALAIRMVSEKKLSDKIEKA